MPKKKKPYSRIAITLPPEVLVSADHLARDMDRSRSWVVAEAIRRFAGGQAKTPGGATGSVVREPADRAYAAPAVAQARIHHLHAALALTPAERLKRAEELLRLARLVHPRPPRTQVIAFDTLEDFVTWKAARRVAP